MPTRSSLVSPFDACEHAPSPCISDDDLNKKDPRELPQRLPRQPRPAPPRRPPRAPPSLVPFADAAAAAPKSSPQASQSASRSIMTHSIFPTAIAIANSPFHDDDDKDDDDDEELLSPAAIRCSFRLAAAAAAAVSAASAASLAPPPHRCLYTPLTRSALPQAPQTRSPMHRRTAMSASTPASVRRPSSAVQSGGSLPRPLHSTSSDNA